MGVDSRGVERGKCTACDCEEYEGKSGQHECGYCGCFPVQHERRHENSAAEEMERAAETKPEMTSGVEKQPKWRDVNLGWLPNAKTVDTIFFNELLPRFYQSAWQVWPNRDRFRQAFVTERRRQWAIEKQLNQIHSQLSFRLSDNPAVIGSVLKAGHTLIMADKGIITDNIERVEAIETKVTELRQKVLEEDLKSK